MPLRRTVSETWSALLDLVYPPKCIVCGRLGPRVLCDSCRAGFMPVPGPHCRRCGNALEQGRCSDCEFRGTHHLIGARSAGLFAGSLRDAILRLKYGPRGLLAKPLGEFLAEMIRARPFWPAEIEAVVPVPLHRSRERDRGFNQAAILAEHVARELGVPVLHALVRKRRTENQADLPAKRRILNVRDAFSVSAPAEVIGRTILIVDDVITSLSTVEECARILLDSGAKAVYAASLAREIRTGVRPSGPIAPTERTK